MDLTAGSRWRKALVISALIHSIVLTSVGWMAGRELLHAQLPETLIELELTNEPEPLTGGAEPQSQIAANPSPVQSLPQPVQQQPVVTEQLPAAEPVVAVSEMAVESVDTGAIAAEVSGGSGAGVPGGAGAGNSAPGGAGGLGTGSGNSSREITPPGILSRREPRYPEQARRTGVEGTVVLRIEILENGHAGDVAIAESSGSELLDEAAVEAVQRWRFVPAKVRGTGQTIACQTTMPVVFRLRT